MEQLTENLNSPVVVIGLIVVSVILLVLCIISIVYNIKLSSRLDKFMGTRSDRHNLEKILLDYYDQVITVDAKYQKLIDDIDYIYGRLKPCIQKVGMVRYNPFENMGGDLSYALTLLDENNTGVIVNTIFSREGSHTYCKPVLRGEAEYTLCYEEDLSLKRAMGLEKSKPRGKDAMKTKASGN